jgi:hypothetical protein
LPVTQGNRTPEIKLQKYQNSQYVPLLFPAYFAEKKGHEQDFITHSRPCNKKVMQTPNPKPP